MTAITRMRRQQKDHDRYMRDRERRLAMQREWAMAHPSYHRDYYLRRTGEEIEKEKHLKELSARIWDLQTRTLDS